MQTYECSVDALSLRCICLRPPFPFPLRNRGSGRTFPSSLTATAEGNNESLSVREVSDPDGSFVQDLSRASFLYSFLNERFDCVRNNGVLIEEKLDGASPPREKLVGQTRY